MGDNRSLYFCVFGPPPRDQSFPLLFTSWLKTCSIASRDDSQVGKQERGECISPPMLTQKQEVLDAGISSFVIWSLNRKKNWTPTCKSVPSLPPFLPYIVKKEWKYFLCSNHWICTDMKKIFFRKRIFNSFGDSISYFDIHESLLS
jgi:hypothetical protein